MTYSEKLKDPRWQKKRLQILQRDNWTCMECCSADKTLHVHHCYYVKKREPWDYPQHSLITLCSTCHSNISENSDNKVRSVAWEEMIELIEQVDPGFNKLLPIIEMLIDAKEKNKNLADLIDKMDIFLWRELTGIRGNDQEMEKLTSSIESHAE